MTRGRNIRPGYLILLAAVVVGLSTWIMANQDGKPVPGAERNPPSAINLSGTNLPQMPAEAEDNAESAELGRSIIELISNTSTAVSDFDWVTRHDLAPEVPRFNFSPLALAGLATADERIPRSFNSYELMRVVDQGETSLLFYGGHFADGAATDVVFALEDSAIVPRYGLNLGNLVGLSEASVDPNFTWAAESDGFLYLKDDDSITAVDPANRRIPWHRNGIATALTFDISGTMLFSGCCGLDSDAGGHGDPTYSVFVLDTGTGAVLQEYEIDSPPRIVLIKGDRLFVRTIQMEWVFRIRG